jgi:hypothetical protein
MLTSLVEPPLTEITTSTNNLTRSQRKQNNNNILPLQRTRGNANPPRPNLAVYEWTLLTKLFLK